MGGFGWPELLSPPRSLQKGFGKPTCCPISAPIIFFKIKGIIFVLGTSTWALSLLPSLCLSPTRNTFLLPWGILAAQGSEKKTTKNRFLPPSCREKGDARPVLGCGLNFPALWEKPRKRLMPVLKT